MTIRPTRISSVKLATLDATKRTALQNSLKATLETELQRQGISQGLKPGDKVAISSSVGQSISF